MNHNEHSVPPSLSSWQELAWPPGNAALIAQFIHSAAPRPVREVAIVGALGLLSGICGRQFQVSKTGLNTYLILVARSGIGKEAMHSGISTLVNAVAVHEPRIRECVNFSSMASGQALIKQCAVTPCFVNPVGEFGHVFASMLNAKPGDTMAILRKTMLELYTKSSASAIAGGISYSNKENNIASILSIAYSIVGDTTPETLYNSITPESMRDGFMSRFTIIQYHGDRPEKNLDLKGPWPELIQGLVSLVRHSSELAMRNSYQNITSSDCAQQILNAFESECDAQIRESTDESWRQMWNRAHLKALRIAGLIAVADNFLFPSISPLHAEWAINLIRRDIGTFTARLEGGDVGNDDAARKDKVIALLLKYLKDPPEKYKALRNVGLAPDQYLQSRTQNVAAFSKYHNGANKALKQTIEALVEGGVLRKALPSDVAERVPKAKGTCYWLMELPGYEQVWKSVYAETDIPWLRKQQ